MKTKLKEKGLFDLDQLVEFEAVQTPLDLQQKRERIMGPFMACRQTRSSRHFSHQ